MHPNWHYLQAVLFTELPKHVFRRTYIIRHFVTSLLKQCISRFSALITVTKLMDAILHNLDG